MKFSYFKSKEGIRNSKISSVITVPEAVKIIQSDEFREPIEKIRSSEDSSLRSALKKTLPYFCFSGEFATRNEQGLKDCSQLICIDFDHVENLETVRKQLCEDFLTHMLFLSPSGDGLKVVIKYSAPVDRFKEVFELLEGYFKHDYNLEIDKSCKDICRACFVSYDPNVFYREDSISVCLPSPELEVLEGGEVVERKDSQIPESNDQKIKFLSEYVGQIDKKKINLVESYQEWLEVCFCLASCGEEARFLFHLVSQQSSKYDAKQCDEKFTNALKTTRFTTPAKFVKMCKEAGLKIDSKKYAKTIKSSRAEGVKIDENTEWTYYNATTKNNIEFETPEQARDVHKYSVTQLGGQYFEAKKFDYDSMTVALRPFSNFTIRPLFLVVSQTDPKRIVEIKNIYGVTKVIDIPTKSFVSQAEFNAYIESQGNFLLFEKTPFIKLKQKIYDQTMDAKEVKVLGWHDDGLYFFANGAFGLGKFHPADRYGIVKIKKSDTDEKNYFLPALSDIYKDSSESYEEDKKFIFIPRPEIKFEAWADLFCKVHGDNGKVGLLFYISSLFSDFVYSKFKFFPHLFLFGLPGSGKSTLAWSISSLFGLAQSPFMLSAGTPVGFYRTFARFRNAIAWFDEFKNDIDPKRIQHLKGAYDRAGHTKGVMDNDTKTTTTKIHSSSMLSGQELPVLDIALFKRVILCQFNDPHHDEEKQKLLKQLQAIEQSGLSHFTAHISAMRRHIEENFETMYDVVKKDLDKLTSNVKESRIIINMAVVLAFYKLLEQRVKFPFSYDNILFTFSAYAKNQFKLISNSNETSQFWDMMAYLWSQHLINSSDFKIKEDSELTIQIDQEKHKMTFHSPKKILFIRLNRIHPLYLENTKKQTGKSGMDKNSIIHYLTSQKSYLGWVKSFRFGEESTYSISSAYAFDYSEIRKMGYTLTNSDEDLDEDNTPVPPNGKISGETGVNDMIEGVPF